MHLFSLFCVAVVQTNPLEVDTDSGKNERIDENKSLRKQCYRTTACVSEWKPLKKL